MRIRSFVFALAMALPCFAAGGLEVHEWGTFTSVAGADGAPVSWLPLTGPSDLPCFVHSLGGRNAKSAFALVRMETPVLYFYSPDPIALSIHVGFPSGLITEWYPQAAAVQPESASGLAGVGGGQIDWSVELAPGERGGFPAEGSPSRYYAARETDAAPVRAGAEREKMIFYRGLGNFSVPLRAVITGDGKVEVHNSGPDPLPFVVLFEKRGDAGYRVVRDLRDWETLDWPEPGAGAERLRGLMESELTTAGLYPKEARAMLETWRDSWFEPGARLLYIVPRPVVDAVLPLSVAPAPSATARVFVGRLEVLAPWVADAIERATAAADIAALKKFGRFLGPFLAEIGRRRPELVDRGLKPAAAR
jgi:hypothetical protein